MEVFDVNGVKKTTGSTGPAGATGPAGIPGIPGNDGENGLDGFSIPGPAGSAGSPGATGPAGLQGSPGIPGNDGEDGLDSLIPGPAGINGTAGVAGATGPAGPQGIPGNDGEDGLDSLIPGPAGANGAAGAPGSNGAQGNAGAPGPPGLDADEPLEPFMIPGPRGADGAAGGLSVVAIAGATGAANSAAAPSETWEVLTANSADITGVTLTTVMAMTSVGVGRYYFKCVLIFQTTATTTGIGVAVNHTGTTTQWTTINYWVDTIATATTAGIRNTGTGAGTGGVAAGNVMGSHASTAKNTLIGAVNIDVQTANADHMMVIEGTFVVSVSGNLEVKLQAELAGLTCRAMQSSTLVLRRFS